MNTSAPTIRKYKPNMVYILRWKIMVKPQTFWQGKFKDVFTSTASQYRPKNRGIFNTETYFFCPFFRKTGTKIILRVKSKLNHPVGPPFEIDVLESLC